MHYMFKTIVRLAVLAAVAAIVILSSCTPAPKKAAGIEKYIPGSISQLMLAANGTEVDISVFAETYSGPPTCAVCDSISSLIYLPADSVQGASTVRRFYKGKTALSYYEDVK